MNREQILADIEDYIGGNVECVDTIDRMALTVFLRAKLNAVRNAALDEARAACEAGIDGTSKPYADACRTCAVVINDLKEQQP